MKLSKKTLFSNSEFLFDFSQMQNIVFCSYKWDLLPYKATEWSIWRDLKLSEDCTIQQWVVTLAPTWVKVALPLGRGVKIYARSSLPVKFGLIVANSVWLIDSDYRGEIKVELTSLNWEKKLEAWTRIAQLEISSYFQEWKSYPTETPQIEMITDSEMYENFAEHFPSERGAGWFGSTSK